MPSLLLELFSEEIPAGLQCRAAVDLGRLIEARLTEAGLAPKAGGQVFSTPRRLTYALDDVPRAQPDRYTEKKGPRLDAPQKALDGFMKANGLQSLEACAIKNDPKGDYYRLVSEVKGRPVSQLIAEFMPDIIEKFPWPKSMRWGTHRLKWIRPLTSILCVFDGEIVPFSVDGISASDKTQGHRFLAPASITARDYTAYEQALRRQKVILSADERSRLIKAHALRLCEAQGLMLVEDDALLEEVTGLSEWPVTLMGCFDEKFLALPEEVLIAAMRGHQKYFSVRDRETGRLAPGFVFVANIEAADGGNAMRRGYERVLAARLSDAWFLYQKDLKTALIIQSEKLDQVTFFKSLGSQGDRMRRIMARAREIAPLTGADPEAAARAAQLAKADLVTEMVGEFASLQGVMGRYYATAENYPFEICEAIEAHYRPAGQRDDVPTAPVSVTLALADRLDMLTSFWAIDEKPSGSRDPFALRRAATGVVQLILVNEIRIDLPSGDLRAFLYDRLVTLLVAEGFTPDQIEAVARDIAGELKADFVALKKQLAALCNFVGGAAGQGVLQAVRRAANILRAEEKKAGFESRGSFDEKLLQEPAERALFSICADVEQNTQSAVLKEDFPAAFQALIPLTMPLDRFFEEVTVNSEDPDLRQNRLELLAFIDRTCRALAEFSRIDG